LELLAAPPESVEKERLQADFRVISAQSLAVRIARNDQMRMGITT
jgi:hypothetical protein